MPVVRRVGRPGLIGLAARTAVVTGTAAAVQNRAADRQRAAHAQQEQFAYETALAQAQVAPPAPAAVGTDLTEELSKLGALHQSGVLTDAEFATAKARLLG